MGKAHLTRFGILAPSYETRFGNGVVGSPKRPFLYQSTAFGHKTHYAVNFGSLHGFLKAEFGKNGMEAFGQHCFACARWPYHDNVINNLKYY